MPTDDCDYLRSAEGLCMARTRGAAVGVKGGVHWFLQTVCLDAVFRVARPRLRLASCAAEAVTGIRERRLTPWTSPWRSRGRVGTPATAAGAFGRAHR